MDPSAETGAGCSGELAEKSGAASAACMDAVQAMDRAGSLIKAGTAMAAASVWHRPARASCLSEASISVQMIDRKVIPHTTALLGGVAAPNGRTGTHLCAPRGSG